MPFCFDNFCFKDVLPHSKSDYVLTVEFLPFFLSKGVFDPMLRSMTTCTSRHCTSCNIIYCAHTE